MSTTFQDLFYLNLNFISIFEHQKCDFGWSAFFHLPILKAIFGPFWALAAIPGPFSFKCGDFGDFRFARLKDIKKPFKMSIGFWV